MRDLMGNLIRKYRRDKARMEANLLFEKEKLLLARVQLDEERRQNELIGEGLARLLREYESTR
jgi:hypothetical protein